MGRGDERLLSKSIAEKLKQKIIQGEWKLCEQLPNEQALVEEFNVSRTTLREAVKVLVSKNILMIERGKGTFVVNTPGIVEDPLGFEFIENHLLVRHLCEYRLALEPSVCEIAAQKATDTQLTLMGELIERMEHMQQNLVKSRNRDHVIDQIAELDAEFHALLYRMTQNMIFIRLIPIINNTVLENYTTSLYRRGDQRLAFAETHKTLYEAIADRDSERARTLCREHMQIMREELCGEILETV